MKNRSIIFLIFLVALLLFACSDSRKESSVTEKAKIIFDTDMGPDYDDVGAIAIIHALADNGECEILATISSNSHPAVAPTIETFNRYYKKPDIPIGVPDQVGIRFTNKNNWNDSLVHRFCPELKNKVDYAPATRVYRQILSSQPDKSVTIVTVGFTTNLENLLKSSGDAYSPLSGIELVRKKVKKLVAMAGKFPEGREYNVYEHKEASFYAFAHWPTPILFSGFEIGSEIFTGNQLAKSGSPDNPVAWAYRYNLATYADTPVENRMSWDQTAVLCAVRNPENYFYVCGPGRFMVDSVGYNRWDPDSNAGHYFLVHKYPYKETAVVLEKLMMHESK
jgi:inosine-uridine nucleoside N-ribohydrolase